MKKTALRAYARLLATVGLHVRPAQQVLISAELDQPEFVRMVVEECYRAGASKVSVDFSYQPLTRADVRYCDPQTLAQVPDWQVARWEWQAQTLPCKLYLLSEDPDGLRGIDQEKYMAGVRARSLRIKPIRDRMENRYQWCIAAVPGTAWAKKLFPDLRPAAAREKLWQSILSCCRADSDPVAAWQAHNDALAARVRALNAMNLRSLHYTSANGTDLTVGLIPGALFAAGQECTQAGIPFNPNIPSEEVFTSPMRGKAEGIVFACMPLSYGGQLIEDFWFRFHEGRVTECGARVGEPLLKSLISMDEGAPYLGECALVPYSSPIRRSGILFYNTLFDENAACHLALGRGFSNLLPDYRELTDEQTLARGINNSIVHEDFMIGSCDLCITGTDAAGTDIPLFRDGEWAF